MEAADNHNLLIHIGYHKTGSSFLQKLIFSNPNLEEPTPAFEPLFRLEYLEYHWLIAYYQKLFGHERVFVLPQEMLKLDKSLFLNSIATFAGTDIPDDAGQEVVKQGYSAFTVALKRWTNLVLAPKHARRDLPWYQRFNNFAFRHLDQVVPKALDQFFTQKLKAYIENRIGNFYQNSNQMTTELIGLDLQAYGYPVKSE